MSTETFSSQGSFWGLRSLQAVLLSAEAGSCTTIKIIQWRAFEACNSLQIMVELLYKEGTDGKVQCLNVLLDAYTFFWLQVDFLRVSLFVHHHKKQLFMLSLFLKIKWKSMYCWSLCENYLYIVPGDQTDCSFCIWLSVIQKLEQRPRRRTLGWFWKTI